LAEIGHHAVHQRLGFRVAKADIKLQQLRAVHGHHEARKQESCKAGRFNGGADDAIQDRVLLARRQNSGIGIGAHAAGIRPLIAIEDGLVILARRERHHVPAIAQNDKTYFLTLEKFFDYQVWAERLNSAFRLEAIMGDRDPLSGGKSIRLQNHRIPRRIQHLQSGCPRGDAIESRRRNPVFREEILSEHLTSFQSRVGLRGSDNLAPGSPEHIHDPGHKRYLGTHHGEVDLEFLGDLEIVGRIHAVRHLGDAGIARRGDDPRHGRALFETPCEGMFAPAAANHQYFHSPKLRLVEGFRAFRSRGDRRLDANMNLDRIMIPQTSVDSSQEPQASGSGEPNQMLFRRIGSLAGIVYFTIALLIGVADIVFILRHYTKYPFGDHWLWLRRFAEGGPPAALLSQYNEHRLFFPGLLYWVDLTLFGGKNGFLVFASVIINIACIIVLALPLLHRRDVPLPIRLTLAGFITILMLWFIQGPNFIYPFSVCLALSNFGILFALYLFTIVRERDDLCLPHGDWLLALCIFCGFVATFSYGHGILIWPVLLLNGVILRRPLRRWAPVAGATVLALFLYFFHYVNPPASAPIGSLLHPLKVAYYFFLMIGLPWLTAENAQAGWRANILQYGIILSSLAIAALFIAYFILRRSKSNCTMFYSSLLLVAMGSAGLAALSRSYFPVYQALSPRYAPIPLLFWISLSALATVYLCRLEVQGGLGRFAWCAILASVSAATLPTQFTMAESLADTTRLQENAVASIAIGVPESIAVNANLCPIPLRKMGCADGACSVITVDREMMLALHHVSFFQIPESSMLRSPLQSRFQISGKCGGSVDDVRLYQRDQNKGVRLSGSIFDSHGHIAPAKILVTDQGGLIVGLGTGGLPGPLGGLSTLPEDAWIAYSQLPADGSRQLRIFGEFPGQPSVCELVSSKTVIPQ